MNGELHLSYSICYLYLVFSQAMHFTDSSGEFSLLLYANAQSYIEERMPMVHQALQMLVAPEHFEVVDSSALCRVVSGDYDTIVD